MQIDLLALVLRFLEPLPLEHLLLEHLPLEALRGGVITATAMMKSGVSEIDDMMIVTIMIDGTMMNVVAILIL